MKRLLIIRPDGIGDFIIFSAVLEEYRNIFPEYRIDILCRPAVRELTETIPFVDRVISIDVRKLFRKKYFLYHFLWALKLKIMRYDKVICPVFSRDKATDYIVKSVRASEKIVFDGDGANDPGNARYQNNQFFTHVISSTRGMVPEIERNAEFINQLGGVLDGKNLKTKIWFSPEDDQAFHKFQEGFGLENGKYVCLFPGAGSPIRYWSNENWAKVIVDLLANDPLIKVVLLGGAGERQLVEDITSIEGIPRERIVKIVGIAGLRLSAKVIENAKLLISTESSAVHMAVAGGTPNICIMGGGHFGRFYPYGDLMKNRIAFHQMDCYGCNWKCIYEQARCVREVLWDQVWQEMRQLI